MDLPLTWKLGIDNVSPKTALPAGALVDCVNIDIDRVGGVDRRAGYALLASANVHSLWTSTLHGFSFAVYNGVLSRVQMPWALTSLYPLEFNAPLAYDDLVDYMVASSPRELLAIDAALTVRKLGLETPAAPAVSAAAVGGLTAGTYGVAISYLRGDEEGALSDATFVTLEEGQGLQVATPTPAEDLPTQVRIYRTSANGAIFMRAADAPLGFSFLVGAGELGRQADNWGLARMLPGAFVRYWHGLLWTVQDNVLTHSEPLRYGLYNPRFNFIQFADVIRMVEPVEGGLFVGTGEGVFFLAGSGPREFAVRKLGGKPPIKGSSTRFPTAFLGQDGDGGEYAALWLAENGFVVGAGNGVLLEKQRRAIQLDQLPSSGATVIHERRALTVVS